MQHRDPARPPWRGVLLAAVLFATATADARPVRAPAVVVTQARDAAGTQDFLRMSFLSAAVQPSGQLGTPTAYRVFVAPTAFFLPGLPTATAADVPGLAYAADRDLLVMRCRPTNPVVLDARLATWPAVLAAVRDDLAVNGFTCPPAVGAAPEQVLYCAVRDFDDVASPVASAAILPGIALGASLFETDEVATVLRRRWGVYPAFAGLGYAIRGSGDDAARPGDDTLVRAVLPEYLVLNATLADAGCRCVRVLPYDGRERARLVPSWVDRHGDATCPTVRRLGSRR